MVSNTLRWLALPAELLDLLRALVQRAPDPRLEQMRWRLHLRLLLISAALCAGFFCLNLAYGRIDETGFGLLASLAAWAWLRPRPQHNRWVARIVLSFFLGLGIYSALFARPPAPNWSLLAMTLMPVFGVLLDGLLLGGLAALVTTLTALCAVQHLSPDASPLLAAFSIPTTLCLYATSVAHTWLFDQLVLQRQRSAQALALSSQATERLARTLSEEVTQATARLRSALDQGLPGLAQASGLRNVLKDARVQLPEALPRSGGDATALLEQLRSSVNRFFLGVALVVALAAMALILWLGLPLWELAALVATITAMLLWLGDAQSPRWRWRLDVFLLSSLAAMGADVLLSSRQPPAASLVFLPLIVYYAGMLGTTTQVLSVSASGLALIALSWGMDVAAPGNGIILTVLSMTTLSMAGIGLATIPLYHGLLLDLHADEERLHQSLMAYRRLVSTLFHDLANPLAVLQGLAALPSDLQAPGDLERAQRMVERLRHVSDSARFAATRQGAGLQPISAAALAESLADLFTERLRERQLTLHTGPGMQRNLRQGGSLLRDSILGNLLSNSIKYAPSGSDLRLSVEPGDGGTWLRLDDAGPGFPAAALQDLAAGIAPRPTPGHEGELGSGFGLLLAQSYARDLGGRLILSNRAEGGAQAELWLPD